MEATVVLAGRKVVLLAARVLESTLLLQYQSVLR